MKSKRQHQAKEGDIINGIYTVVKRPLCLPVPDDEVCPHNNHISSSCSDCDEESADYMCPLCNKHWNDHTPDGYIFCNNELNLIIEQYAHDDSVRPKFEVLIENRLINKERS